MRHHIRYPNRNEGISRGADGTYSSASASASTVKGSTLVIVTWPSGSVSPLGLGVSVASAAVTITALGLGVSRVSASVTMTKLSSSVLQFKLEPLQTEPKKEKHK